MFDGEQVPPVYVNRHQAAAHRDAMAWIAAQVRQDRDRYRELESEILDGFHVRETLTFLVGLGAAYVKGIAARLEKSDDEALDVLLAALSAFMSSPEDDYV